jgi:hypothetical protein
VQPQPTKPAPVTPKNPLLNSLLLWHNSDLMEESVRDEEQYMQNEPLQTPITGTDTLNVQQAEATPPSQAKRRKVFISYNRSDSRYLDELVIHLKPYMRNGSMEVWYDKKIEAGDAWFEEIQRAIDETRIAVLLVSAGFLASDFIYEHELAPLLEAYKAKEVKLLPVVVSPCTFSDTPLSGLQGVNDPKYSLSKMKASERDELWVKLVKDLKRMLGIK